jgi:uroporphyrinogen-III decarboxylase
LKQWADIVKECDDEALSQGKPSIFGGGLVKAPFDVLGDTMRGVQGTVMDMYRQPDKLKEAMERMVPIIIKAGVTPLEKFAPPTIVIPLHKGEDSFMSPKQYREFYWPTLKKVLMGLVDEGLLPILFAEGSYMKRLDIIKEMPRGSVAWYFDQTDMATAKEVLGDTACIIGNVPTSVLITGTPAQVKEHCRKLIETCSKGGGYILAGGAALEEGNPDNLRAMIEAVKEYGVYK